MNAEKTRRGFLVWPDDTVDEVDDDGCGIVGKAPGLHARLVVNGVPLNGGDDPKWAQVLDLSFNEHGAVTAYTTGAAPLEHSIPREAVKPLLDWLEREEA